MRPPPHLFSLFVTLPPPRPPAHRTSFRPSFVPSFSSMLCLCLGPSFHPLVHTPISPAAEAPSSEHFPGPCTGQLLPNAPKAPDTPWTGVPSASLLSMLILPARRGHLKGRHIICPCAVSPEKSTVPDLYSKGLTDVLE